MLKLNSSNSNSIQLNGYGYGCVPKIQFFVGLSSKIYPTYQSHRKVKKFKGASTGINTSYLTDSYIFFTLKLESGSKITVFGLKMMVKSGLEKIILKSLHAGRSYKYIQPEARG